MSVDKITARGAVYHSENNASVAVAAGGTTDFGISLSLPPGSYVVIVHCSFAKSGSASGSAYGKMELSVNGVAQSTGRTQGSSASSSDQLICSSVFAISINTTSTVKPFFSAMANPISVFDVQSIDAIRIS